MYEDNETAKRKLHSWEAYCLPNCSRKPIESNGRLVVKLRAGSSNYYDEIDHYDKLYYYYYFLILVNNEFTGYTLQFWYILEIKGGMLTKKQLELI